MLSKRLRGFSQEVCILILANLILYLTLLLVDCSWVRYDLTRDVPSNFVALGDAVLRLNPIYGYVLLTLRFSSSSLPWFRSQGIVKSCMDCTTLDKSLRQKSLSKGGRLAKGFSAFYFKTQYTRIEGLWFVL